ncbi:cytochrome P450 [Aspergillus affinis]|uniref:cytochrome P450 n=1 Tax=Aspergillus affinis TaxID=1070780 RepID=UPI0022FE3AE4|nr:cytochrome P450 [Aspergillus affinis]KAI9037331.1 cytochrome P450 [Aspergillus affinis]
MMSDSISNSEVFFTAMSSVKQLHCRTFALVEAISATLLWTLTIGICLIGWALFGRPLQDSCGNRIPKGPLGLPILGSFPFLTRYPELTLDYWAKKFGNLYSFWLGNRLFVIVSDPHIVKDLMVTNGSVFSSRPDMFVKCQTVFAGRGIATTPYNDRWRKHRRIALSWLSQKAVDSHTETVDRESMSLIKAMFDGSQQGKVPVRPHSQIGRCLFNVMATITFGFRIDSIEHPLIMQALKLNREFMNCTGSVSNLVDFVPLLQYFPTPMHERGKRIHRGLVNIYGGLFKNVEKQLEEGKPVPDCLGKTMVEIQDKEQLDDLDMTMLASAFMLAGVENPGALLQWFSALIPTFPEVQKKAQAELDRVVGRDRLPTIDDEKSLPYCRAIIKEVERVHNPFWLGTPHATSEDFVCRGQFIPKDTVVIINTWTMHHDPVRYPIPDLFNPDRYIHDSLKSAESAHLADPEKRDHWMFGAGRRMCPGVNLAERVIWLSISRLLWAFDMVEIPDEPIDRKDYDGKSARSPVPFRIKLTPRHANVARVLEGIAI